MKVNELIFPVDFYILEMDGNSSSKSASILLGRPFMKTAKTKIDVDEGTLSVEFDGEIVKFNIFDAMKYPNDVHSLYQIDVIDSVVRMSLQKPCQTSKALVHQFVPIGFYMKMVSKQ